MSTITSDEDVPPLEDMSEMLHQVEILKEKKREKNNQTKDFSETRDEKPNKQRYSNSSEARTGNITEHSQTTTKDEKKIESFGGLKKGFLFGGTSENKPKVVQTIAKKSNVKKTQQDVVQLPLIKPKNSKEEEYCIPEVQKAMNASQTFLQNKDWVTEDLLKTITKSETLGNKLEDPKFMQAMTEFQTNPAEAMRKYEHNTEVQSFLKEFCGVLGQHFEKLSEDQEKKSSNNPKVKPTDSIQVVTQSGEGADLSVHSSTNPNQPTAEDENKMQEILSRPEIKEVLLDPRIQKLLETLRTDPDKAQRALHLADQDMQQKIKKLVDCGLLGMKR